MVYQTVISIFWPVNRGEEKKHVDPPQQGLVKELRMNGKTLLGGFFFSWSWAVLVIFANDDKIQLREASLGWNQVLKYPHMARRNWIDPIHVTRISSDIWYWKGTNYSCLDINCFIISPLISHYCSYRRELLAIQEWFYQINSINKTSYHIFHIPDNHIEIIVSWCSQ